MDKRHWHVLTGHDEIRLLWGSRSNAAGPRRSVGEAIHQIGWSDAVILVQLEPCVEKGPPSGWRVVDVKTQKIETIDERVIKIRSDLKGLN